MTRVHTPPIRFYIPWHLDRDHLIETCPALQRADAGDRYPNYFEGAPATFHLPPLTRGAVCGWCTRVWLARHSDDATPCDCEQDTP